MLVLYIVKCCVEFGRNGEFLVTLAYKKCLQRGSNLCGNSQLCQIYYTILHISIGEMHWKSWKYAAPVRKYMSVLLHHQIGLVPVPASKPDAVSQLSLSLTFMLHDGCLGNCLDGGVNVRWVLNRYWFFSNFHCLSPLHLSFVSPAVWRPRHWGVCKPMNPTQSWQEKPRQELRRVKGWQWPPTNNTVNTLRSAGWLRTRVTGGVNENSY